MADLDYKAKSEWLDFTEVMLLEVAGVDNWDGYYDALGDDSGTLIPNLSESETLELLNDHGVDGWMWHEMALEGFSEYQTYIREPGELSEKMGFRGWNTQ